MRSKTNLWLTSGDYDNIRMKEQKAEIPVDDTVYSSTPYDDVFRTLLNDCSRLILPVLNEIFGENYTGVAGSKEVNVSTR